VVPDDGWHTACRVDELVEGEPISATVEGVGVAVVLQRGRTRAIAAVCSHAGGPLDRGDVRDDVIVCPWHGSEFCLDDGSVVRGPAASREPVYDTRVRGQLVEVRLRATLDSPRSQGIDLADQRTEPAVAARNAGSTSRS
jgi:nitrite reductase/ring-hydroxylating ferredoxin subunit